MGADANIFAQYLRPQKSVNDYMAEMDEADIRREQLTGAKRQNALQALIAQDTMDQRRIAGEDRTRLRGLAGQSGGDTNKLVQLLRSSGSAGLMSQADALEKGYLDRQKTEAEVGEKKAKTTKEQGGVLDDAMKRYRGALDFIDTPEGAARWLQAQYSDPVLGEHVSRLAPIEQAVQQIPRDPQAFAQWRQQSALGMEKFLEQQRLRETQAQSARNDLIGPDGKPNQTLIGAKQSIAKAGASSVSVNTGQKGLDNEFKLRGEFKQEPIYKAHQEMQSAYSQIKQALSQASPAGDLAGATKIMKLLDPGSVVRESELGMAMAASGLMDRVTNYANMIVTGQKLTPTQRKDFQRLADALMEESNKQFNGKRSEYQRLGGEYGLNADRALGPSVGSPAATPAAPKVMKFDANGNLVAQ